MGEDGVRKSKFPRGCERAPPSEDAAGKSGVAAPDQSNAGSGGEDDVLTRLCNPKNFTGTAATGHLPTVVDLEGGVGVSCNSWFFFIVRGGRCPPPTPAMFFRELNLCAGSIPRTVFCFCNFGVSVIHAPPVVVMFCLGTRLSPRLCWFPGGSGSGEATWVSPCDYRAWKRGPLLVYSPDNVFSETASRKPK